MEHDCRRKLNACHVFAKSHCIYLCVKSAQSDERFLFGDIVHFSKFDSEDREVLWVFVGGEIKYSQVDLVALYFVEQGYYANSDNSKLYLLMADAQAFREQVERRGSVFSQAPNDLEYFQSDHFTDLISEATLDFVDGQYETESNDLESKKFVIIGDIKLKGSKRKKNAPNLASSPFLSAVQSRQAAAEQKENRRLENEKEKEERNEKIRKEKKAEKKGKADTIVVVTPKQTKNPVKSKKVKLQLTDAKLSPYLAFCAEARNSIKMANPDISFGDLGKKLGQLWHSLTPKQKVLAIMIQHCLFSSYSWNDVGKI